MALLTKNEELAFVREYQATRNPAILSRLLRAHGGYIRQVALKVHRAFRGDVELDDLIQAATVGLINGINKFNTEAGTRLLTYAHFWMMDELFQTYQLSLPIHIPSHTLRQMCWRNDKQRAEELNKMYEKIARPLQLQRIHDDATSEDVVLKRTEFQMACDTTIEHFEKHTIGEDIKKALDSLPEKQKKALWLRAGLDMDGGEYMPREIAKMMQCSVDEVNNHLRYAKHYLKKQPAIKRLREVA